MKTITIIDSFISSKSTEDTLIRNLNKLNDFEILLVSTGKVSEEIQDKVKYFFYDSRNTLFKSDDYIYMQPWNFWLGNDRFTSYHFYYSKQRHGLAVMINLFNSLVIAKNLGYTHFQKILYDVELNEDSISFLKNIENICLNEVKKGLVYYNENQDFPDMNGEYFFCEIDYFLSKIPIIRSESDYKSIVYDLYHELKFLIFEKYLYELFKKNGDSELLIKTENDFYFDFNINKFGRKGQTTKLNFDEKYDGCLTRITKIKNEDSLLVLSHNFNDKEKNRKIVVFKNNNSYTISQNVPPTGWSYNYVDKDINRIDVYENDIFLYTEDNDDIKNYLEWR